MCEHLVLLECSALLFCQTPRLTIQGFTRSHFHLIVPQLSREEAEGTGDAGFSACWCLIDLNLATRRCQPVPPMGL